MDNYPPGARNDPDAPYNREEPEYVSVDVYGSFTLGKHAAVDVCDYHYECDDDNVPVRYYDCNFNNQFQYQRLNPLEIIQRAKPYVENFKSVLECELKEGKCREDSLRVMRDEIEKMNYLLEEMDGWEEEDSCVVED